MKTDIAIEADKRTASELQVRSSEWLAGATIHLRRKSEWHWVAFVEGEEMYPGVSLHGSGVTPEGALSTLVSNIQALRLAPANAEVRQAGPGDSK